MGVSDCADLCIRECECNENDGESLFSLEICNLKWSSKFFHAFSYVTSQGIHFFLLFMTKLASYLYIYKYICDLIILISHVGAKKKLLQ